MLRFATRASESTDQAPRRGFAPPTRRRALACRSTTARWLAERYCLYVVDEHGGVLRGDIHHSPWPLQPAAATIEANTMAVPLGIDLQGDPLLHYSARQDVLIWPLEPV